jgi:chemotaxis protein CheY-P-specific phosphatase CheC
MNAFLNYRLDDNMAQELEETIATSTIEIFEQIFGYKLSFKPANDTTYESDIIIAYVEFWENFETFNACFIFEKHLILSLVGQVYEDNVLTNDSVDELCKDAVCELVNIISNKIKLCINKQGFNSVMEIPTAEITRDINTANMLHKIRINFCPSSAEASKTVVYVGLKDI